MTEAQIGEIVGLIATFGLMLIMLSMGIMLRVRDFINVVRTPTASLLGLAGQILLLPIMAFGICLINTPVPADGSRILPPLNPNLSNA